VPSGHSAALSVADVLRDHVAELFLDRDQARAAAHILACRTGRLGGHVAVCTTCGAHSFAYHSCRDRHCPRCGGLDQALWAEAQLPHLLPVSYFHVVFTLPARLRPFFARHPDRTRARADALNALFAAVAETLLEAAATTGIRIGILAVLHTWNQRLDSHPHIHCLVPGGGLSPSGFVQRRRFLLPLRVLRPLFKGKLLSKLQALLRDGGAAVANASGHELLRDAARQNWNIHIRRPFAGPEQVVQYFARYTRRIAISDRRLLDYDGHNVTFRCRDPKNHRRSLRVRIDASTFARRFLNHVLPSRFVRIRRYGILANRVREKALLAARESLHADPPQLPAPQGESRSAACLRIFQWDPERCPDCGQDTLLVLVTWKPRLHGSFMPQTLPRPP
jgi:hypothetical protein